MEAAGLAQYVAARQIGRLDIGQVDRGALSRHGAARGAAVHLHAAHAQAAPGGVDFDFLLLGHGSGNQRAGGHSAEAFHGEDAVDGQAEVSSRVLFADSRRDARQFAAQIVEPGAGDRTHRHNRRAFEERAGDHLFHFEAHEAENVVIHQVRFGEGDDAAADAEQAADVEMLAGLRLDGFIGGDHEEQEIDSAHTGEHVLDEALVAGDIDKSQAQGGCEFEVREAQIDGDAAAFFLLQPVGVDARERLDERGLAVIDVSRRPDDDVLHGLVTV